MTLVLPTEYPQIVGSYVYVFLLSLVLTGVVRSLALRLNIVDRPDRERKKHKQATPLLGGLGPFIAFTTGVIGLSYFMPTIFSSQNLSRSSIVGFLLASAVLIINGVRDDRRTLSPWQQLFGQIIAAWIIIASGILVRSFSLPGSSVFSLIDIAFSFQFAGIDIVLPWLSILITFMWIVMMVNVTNLVDGMDGLLGSITWISGIVIALVSVRPDIIQPGTTLLAAIFTAAVGGFLVWNAPPARIFAGNTGSTWFGLMIAVLAIISGSKIATAGLVMVVPVVDLVWVAVERWRNGMPITKGDRRHLHLRLQDQGWSVWQVLLLYILANLLLGSIALFFGTEGKIIGFGVTLPLLIGFLWWRSSIASRQVVSQGLDEARQSP